MEEPLNRQLVVIEKNPVYAARCKIHGSLYIGQTGDSLQKRFSKHRYDAKKRPGNNELATHIAKYNHDSENDIDVMILQNNLKASAEREYYEDRYICLLGTKQPHGLNQDVSAFLLTKRHDVIKLVKKTLH